MCVLIGYVCVSYINDLRCVCMCMLFGNECVSPYIKVYVDVTFVFVYIVILRLFCY